MKKSLFLFTILIFNSQAQVQSLRSLSDKEQKLIFAQGQQAQLVEAGTNYALQTEIRAVEFSLMQEFHKSGSISQKLSEGYIQHLTNRGFSKTDIKRRVSSMMKGYFNNLQVLNADKALDQTKKDYYEEKLKDVTEEESGSILDALHDEILASPMSKENEKTSEKFSTSFFKALEKDYTKKAMPVPTAENLEYIVPADFSIQSKNIEKAKTDSQLYCVQKVNKPISEQAVDLANSLENVIEKDSKKKGIQEIWISWGYNRDWHSKSDAMFKTLYGDFTIHDAYGDDVPKKFGIYYFDPEKISIPQYNIEIGVMFNDKWGMDLHMDHMKWKFDRLRDYEITGDFSKKVWSTRGSRKTFEEAIRDKDASWLRFEHTDGYNYLSLGLIRNLKLVESKSGNFDIDARVSGGAGLMVPRTDIRLYYQKDDGGSDRYGINNKFHIAGYGVHADARLKFTFWDKVFLQATVRGSRIKVKNALVDGVGASLEHTPINSVQVIGQIGYQHKFKMKSKTENKKEEIEKKRAQAQ